MVDHRLRIRLQQASYSALYLGVMLRDSLMLTQMIKPRVHHVTFHEGAGRAGVFENLPERCAVTAARETEQLDLLQKFRLIEFISAP